jgi:hypothetical protein
MRAARVPTWRTVDGLRGCAPRFVVASCSSGRAPWRGASASVTGAGLALPRCSPAAAISAGTAAPGAAARDRRRLARQPPAPATQALRTGAHGAHPLLEPLPCPTDPHSTPPPTLLQIAEHFVRVTNDRQSKKGWLWSERNWGSMDAWTITLRLRVSGQGKRLFGDGACRGAVRPPTVHAAAAGRSAGAVAPVAFSRRCWRRPPLLSPHPRYRVTHTPHR